MKGYKGSSSATTARSHRVEPNCPISLLHRQNFARRRFAAPKQGSPYRPRGAKQWWPHKKSDPRKSISWFTRTSRREAGIAGLTADRASSFGQEPGLIVAVRVSRVHRTRFTAASSSRERENGCREGLSEYICREGGTTGGSHRAGCRNTCRAVYCTFQTNVQTLR